MYTEGVEVFTCKYISRQGLCMCLAHPWHFLSVLLFLSALEIDLFELEYSYAESKQISNTILIFNIYTVEIKNTQHVQAVDVRVI